MLHELAATCYRSPAGALTSPKYPPYAAPVAAWTSVPPAATALAMVWATASRDSTMQIRDFAVPGAFAEQFAAMGVQVIEQRAALHADLSAKGSRITSLPAAARRASSRLTARMSLATS
jgi:hypothetical protein